LANWPNVAIWRVGNWLRLDNFAVTNFLLVASAAFVLLWIFAEELLGLLGERFVAVANIFSFS
jgi:hypothetical protein